MSSKQQSHFLHAMTKRLSPIIHAAERTYLLHLSRCASKQLYVALPQNLLVLFQGVLSVFFTREEHKGVAGGPSVGVLDEEQALGVVCNWALWAEEGQHLLGRGSER